MKKFFLSIGAWFKRHAPSKRRLIQLYAALLYNANIKGYITGNIYDGPVKNACLPGLNCYSCPGAIAACPLGSLQSTLAGSTASAPMYVIGILGLFGLFLARTICGFLCPVGLGQELLYKIKTPKIKKSRITRILSYLKYVFLFVFVIILPVFLSSPTFCKYICPAGVFEGSFGLLQNPANEGLFASLGSLFTWKFALLVAIIVLSIFCYRAFCRFFCPLGAIYGFFNKIALMGVKLDNSKCTDCGLCVNFCKMDIRKVGDHECINCGECIPVCPAKAISWKGSKIFLRPTSASPREAVNEGEKGVSLAAIAASGTTISPPHSPPQPVNPPEPVIEPAEPVQTPTITEENAEPSPKPEEPRKKLTYAQRVDRRNLILTISAWAVAIAVLIAALLYFNVFAKDKPRSGIEIGDACPQFTVRLYERNPDDTYLYDEENGASYTVSDSLGKVTVLNFWGTWCPPCVHELPDFDRLQKAYPDTVSVIAIHAAMITENVEDYIENNFKDFSLTFAQDETFEGVNVYDLLGGISGAYPMTVILDSDGIIRFRTMGDMEYDALLEKVEQFL